MVKNRAFWSGVVRKEVVVFSFTDYEQWLVQNYSDGLKTYDSQQEAIRAYNLHFDEFFEEIYTKLSDEFEMVHSDFQQKFFVFTRRS